MAEQSIKADGQTGVEALSALDDEILDDLRKKHELLSAACRCLSDHRYYMFFDRMAAVARRPVEDRDMFLREVEASGLYDEHERDVIERLISRDGAVAFKELVDHIRGIRVQQEIERMVG
jgi:hypothetical protein